MNNENLYQLIIDTGYGFDDGRGFEHLDDFDDDNETENDTEKVS